MAGSAWVFVKATWKGGTTFVIENRDGCKTTIAARVKKDEKPCRFSPVDAFIASLAACAGTNVVLLLQDAKSDIGSLTVKAECILGTAEPRLFEKIHLIFLAGGTCDDESIRSAIVRSMTLVCPIAVTVGKAADVTWELQLAKQ